MFRFFRYDGTGYKDFENSIFSNLSRSQFDRQLDKLTIENIEYRLSAIIEICDNCRNNENELINEIMTINGRTVHRTITTPGAVGTIPATNDHRDGSWLPTDLYEGEVLVNTTDNKAFIRIGNEIRTWGLNPVISFQMPQIEFIEPESLTVGQDPVTVHIYGAFLDNIVDVDVDNIAYGVLLSNFKIFDSGHISVDVDPSQANIGPSSGESLIIYFLLNLPGEMINISLSLLAGELPDPIIESIEPYNNPGFIAGEQTVIITGTNLNSLDGLSINPENDLITQLSYEFDENGYILAQMDIPVELLNTTQNFTLTYDGYMTEPFQVLLSESDLQTTPVITSVTEVDGTDVTTGTTEIIINGTDLTNGGTLNIRELGTGLFLAFGPPTWTDTIIAVPGIDFTPYAGVNIEVTVTDINDNISEPFIFTL
jgi:hypothetical protein